MNYLFLASLAAIFLVILWIPTCAVGFWLKGLQVPMPSSRLWIVLPVQLVVAVGLICLSASVGLHNPAGYSLVITIATSVVGAAALWRWQRPAL